jgi:CBS domain-containing protein
MEVLMKLSDIMTRNVEVIHPNSPLQEAAIKMRDLNVGAIPVCDGDRLKGMLTDRDITIRSAAEGRDPKTTRASEVMTPEVIYCFEDQDVEEAARLMANRQVRRLLILNREKRLVGIVSLGDLSVDVGNERLSGDTLEDISKPSSPTRAS